MSETDIIEIYNDLFRKTWSKMVSIIGEHSVTVLVQRSLWLTQQKYKEAEAIHLSDSGLSLVALEDYDPELMKNMLEDFFEALIGILTKLVGKDISAKMAAGIDLALKRKEV